MMTRRRTRGRGDPPPQDSANEEADTAAPANNSETEYETSHESDREPAENEPEVASALTPEESEASGDEEIEFKEADVTIQQLQTNSDESPAQRAARSVQSALEQLPPDVINAIMGEYPGNPTANLAQLLVRQPAQRSATEASKAETVVTVVKKTNGGMKKQPPRRVQSATAAPPRGASVATEHDAPADPGPKPRKQGSDDGATKIQQRPAGHNGSALPPEEPEVSAEEHEDKEANAIRSRYADLDESPAQRAARFIQSVLERLPHEVIETISGEYLNYSTTNHAQLLGCYPARQSATEANEVGTVEPRTTTTIKKPNFPCISSANTTPNSGTKVSKAKSVANITAKHMKKLIAARAQSAITIDYDTSGVVKLGC